MQFIKGSKASRGVFAWTPQTLLFPIVFSIFAFQPIFSDSSSRLVAQEAAQPAAAAAEPAPAPAADKPAPGEESLLRWLTDSLGWTYILVFLSLSFILVALFIMNLLSARREYVCPQHLIDGFEAHLEEKQYQEAYELAKTDESFLGNVLSAGLAKLSSSYSASVAAMQEVGADENMKLDHRLSYLALIGTISPMIGLFGTVHGMINSFYVIANGGGTPDPNKLAEGISTALLTTLIGLAIAIPAIAAYNILRNRVQRLVLEVGITSENLMGRFEKVGKKKD
ncbi:MAG: MotA/TolQ/ExbB proton channel family protein [Pirellulales bacterium]|jgi:biopolymer transport protein ExbB